MYDSTTVSVGLDVHASSIRFAAVRGDELLEERMLAYDVEGVARCVRRWPGVRCCYEAGPTGFDLYRHLIERGIDCEVVAPALVPERPGDRVKTDSRDARKLARLYAGGLLEPIWVPSPELEAARDLIRAREDARLERMAARHRLSKLLLRNGRRLPGKSWGVTRRRWLGEQRASSSVRCSSRTTITCMRSISSTRASPRSSRRSRHWPGRGRGPSWSQGSAVCVGSRR